MKAAIKQILKVSLPAVLSLILWIPDTTQYATAKTEQAQVLKVSSKKDFRAIHEGSRYTIQLRKKKVRTCQTSQSSVAAVRGRSTIQAKKTGKAVVTITDQDNQKYRLSLWVRPVTEYNQKTQKVCMVGNSHFRTGRQPDYLKGIAALYGQKVKILNESIDGWMLSQHLQNAKKGKSIAGSLKKADIVVFQEYGGRYDTSLDSMLAMKEYCKNSVRLYYYATEYDIYWDWDLRRAELEKNGITVIASGTLLERMYSMGFTYADLHDAYDDHPNCLNGYVSSMLMHARIFQEKCSDFPTRQYMDYFEPIVPGKTKAQKWKQFKKICKVADELAA